MSLSRKVRALAIAARNLAWGCNMISLRLLCKPMHWVGYVNESLFLYRTYADARGLPQKNVFEVIRLSSASVEDVTLCYLSDADPVCTAWFHTVASYTADLVSLCLLCRIMKPKTVFEIGTLHGYTSLHFALNTPVDSKIFTLDLPQDKAVQPRLQTTIMDDWHIASERSRLCFQGSPVASKITCLYADSATFDYTPYFSKVDLFFIDGAHSYEYVRSDTRNALKCCHPRSVIAWHDFGRVGVNGVSRWLLELARDHEVYAIPGGSLAFMVVP